METKSTISACYLDYNATAPLRPTARTAVTAALDRFGNPSSVHRAGREARALVEDARDAVAQATGVAPAQVIFTSGATEANALALRGLAARTVLAPATEHPSVLAHVEPQNHLAVDSHGVVDLGALEKTLAASRAPVLVALMLANNETGVIQPVAEVVALARRHGALIHCDAVQGFGKLSVDLTALGVDSLALSGHKVGAPKGVGALIVRPGLEVIAQTTGGGQERRRRAGTENTVGIAGFGAVAGEIGDLLRVVPGIAALRDHLERELLAQTPEVQVFGTGRPRLANTSCFALPGVASLAQIMALDLAGVAVSAGAACSSGKVTPSHVLLAMGVDPDLAGCALRVSLGWATSRDDVDRFLAAFVALARKHGKAKTGALAGSPSS